MGPSGARRADLNLFPPSSDVSYNLWDASTDGAILMANALMWVASADGPLDSFSFNITGSNGCVNRFYATIDQTTQQAIVHVPYGLDITNLVASFRLEDPATSYMTHSEDSPVTMVSGVSPGLDYTTPVAFTVHREDGSTLEYFVTVVVDENRCNKIESIQFESTFDSCYEDDIVVDLMFTEELNNVWTLEVPYGTDPDADRVGVAVAHKGGVEYLNGNQIGALLLDYILGSLTKQDRLPKKPLVLKSIVTSELQTAIAKSFKKTFIFLHAL